MHIFCTPDAVIENYFLSLNKKDFEAVSQLFSIEGSLCPPFEKEVSGRAAIAQYLRSEAKDIKAFPKTCVMEYIVDDIAQYKVFGYVATSFFKVNVSWSIQLNAIKEIVCIQVKLLAELQDLLALK